MIACGVSCCSNCTYFLSLVYLLACFNGNTTRLKVCINGTIVLSIVLTVVYHNIVTVSVTAAAAVNLTAACNLTIVMGTGAATNCNST